MERRISVTKKPPLVDAEKFLGRICLFVSGALFVLVIDFMARVQ